MTEKFSLTPTAQHHLDAGRRGSNGGSSQTVFGGHEHTLYWDGTPGDLIIIPDPRHTLHALEDAAVLLTVAKTQTP